MTHVPPRLPLGLHEGLHAADRLTITGAAQQPAPVGLAIDPQDGAGTPAAFDHRSAGVVRVEATFTLTPHTYRVLNPHEGWRGGEKDARLEPAEARRVLDAALHLLRDRSDLTPLLRHAARHLNELDPGRRFIVVRQHLLALPAAQDPVRETTSASPLPRAETVDAPPPREDDGFSPLLAAEQAATLRMAARFGIPFCEECARLAS